VAPFAEEQDQTAAIHQLIEAGSMVIIGAEDSH
jgi:hypothetical protein